LKLIKGPNDLLNLKEIVAATTTPYDIQ